VEEEDGAGDFASGGFRSATAQYDNFGGAQTGACMDLMSENNSFVLATVTSASAAADVKPRIVLMGLRKYGRLIGEDFF